ncbi:MAG: ParB N-terminal domain-containing protein [Clostridium sp.]|nr:ParB N-terminal domain-containing protein [Clostridium sp.]
MHNRVLKNINDLFQDTSIVDLSIAELVSYSEHPFMLYEGDRLDNMVQSIKDLGIINPIIVREYARGLYEILAGHNRVNAAKLAGLEKIPAIIKDNLTDDEAKWIVTESNLMQRSFSDMSYSERAAALYQHHKMLRSQGKRMDLLRVIDDMNDEEAFGQLDQKIDSREKVGKEFCLAPRTVGRYLRIYKLDDRLKQLLDNDKIAFTVAENISYLKIQEQQLIADIIQSLNIKISNKQAAELKALSKQSEITMEILSEVLCSKEKKVTTKTIKLESEILEKYFNNESKEEIITIIERALEAYYLNKSS